MIYIKKTETSIKLPKYTQINSSKYKLELFNKLNSKKYLMRVFDLSVDKIFYTFDISEYIESLQEGEYSYKVILGEEEVSNGLLTVGEYSKEQLEYNKDNEIITYQR